MSQLARRYARVACANLAPGSAQALAADLQRCAEVLADHPPLRQALDHPALRDSRLALLRRLVVHLDLAPLAVRLTEALVGNGRAHLLATVVAEVSNLATQRAGELRARVYAAAPLSADQQTALAAALHRRLGKAILLHVEVDPALLGGLRCEVGDFIFDSTLRGHLARLRERVARQGIGRA